jgi:hypothetical protein
MQYQMCEYVTLKILPENSFAIDRSNGSVIPVSQRKTLAQLKKNLFVNKKTGDVWVKNVPMVNQGEKGYCAPASVERCFRHLGINIDQHIISKEADTSFGGGSAVLKTIRAIETLGKKQGLKVNKVSLKKRQVISRISPVINKGIPVLWAMFVYSELEKKANERTKKRQSMDFAEYRAYLKKDIQHMRSFDPQFFDGGHIRLIIGYNPQTREIAFSDTWGSDYVIRWLHEDEVFFTSSLKRVYKFPANLFYMTP